MATAKVISRPRFRDITWQDGESILGPPSCRSRALLQRYIPQFFFLGNLVGFSKENRLLVITNPKNVFTLTSYIKTRENYINTNKSGILKKQKKKKKQQKKNTEKTFDLQPMHLLQ